jgi:membrane-associated protease RseP (regulator of RpoE activity)
MVTILILSMSFLTAGNLLAYDFYGAIVADIDAPSNYMRLGIVGPRPTVVSVHRDSPADQAGIKQGNLIQSINNNPVNSTSDLSQFTAGKLNVLVYSGDEQFTLVVDSFAGGTGPSITNSGSSAGVAVMPADPPPYVVEPDNAPAVILNDATLDARYGVTTPAQRAVEAQRAEQIRLQNERNLGLEQSRELQRRSYETEQSRQREQTERTLNREEAEGRGGYEEQKKSDEMRRNEIQREGEIGRGRR